MGVHRLTRRDILRLGAAATAAAGVRGLVTVPASADDTIPEVISSSFAVRVDGLDLAQPEILAVTIDDLVVDEQVTTAAARKLRQTNASGDVATDAVSGPGDAHYGNVSLLAKDRAASELGAWFDEASQGRNIRKSISVIALRRDGSEARRYEFLDCFPTRFTGPGFDHAHGVATWTLEVRVNRIDMA